MGVDGSENVSGVFGAEFVRLHPVNKAPIRQKIEIRNIRFISAPMGFCAAVCHGRN
jgi:hypothetical protein